jgi:hypothetical protein
MDYTLTFKVNSHRTSGIYMRLVLGVGEHRTAV